MPRSERHNRFESIVLRVENMQGLGDDPCDMLRYPTCARLLAMAASVGKYSTWGVSKKIAAHKQRNGSFSAGKMVFLFHV